MNLIYDIAYYSNNGKAEKIEGDEYGPDYTLGNSKSGDVVVTNDSGVLPAYIRYGWQKLTGERQ
ncbi:MAG TPA: hypothetical protein VGJ81_15870 [Thermoanaerobaculia bacterium]|jgi:hypothetical protein